MTTQTDKPIKAPEIDPPKGWVPPEHDGDEFDVVTRCKVKPDGKLCILKLGESAYAKLAHDDDGDEDKGKPPSYRPMANQIVSDLDTAPM